MQPANTQFASWRKIGAGVLFCDCLTKTKYHPGKTLVDKKNVHESMAVHLLLSPWHDSSFQPVRFSVIFFTLRQVTAWLACYRTYKSTQDYYIHMNTQLVALDCGHKKCIASNTGRGFWGVVWYTHTQRRGQAWMCIKCDNFISAWWWVAGEWNAWGEKGLW